MSRAVLGTPGVNYPRTRLGDGNALAQLLCTAIDLEGGQTFAFLPPGIQLSASTNWSHGLGMSRAESVTTVCGALADIAGGHEDAICVFEDSEARPGDPWLATAKSDIRVLGSEVYHVANASLPAGIGEAMGWAESSWLLIGVLANPFSGWEYPADDRITEQDLWELVASTVAIVVSAFDGEGYVVWAAPA